MTCKTLLILPHNDDEIFFVDAVLKELEAGNQVFISYLTHGSIKGSQSHKRMNESIKAFKALGIGKENIYFLGHEKEIFDSSLEDNMSEAFAALQERYGNEGIGKILTLAWEGGNTDHDASNVLSRILAAHWSIESEVYEYPAYNSDTNIPFYFRIMRFPGKNIKHNEITPVSLSRALYILSFVRFFPSQWQSFVGLLPGMIWQLLVKRKIEYRRQDNIQALTKPHAGTLLYESRFKKNHQKFMKLMQDSLANHSPDT